MIAAERRLPPRRKHVRVLFTDGSWRPAEVLAWHPGRGIIDGRGQVSERWYAYRKESFRPQRRHTRRSAHRKCRLRFVHDSVCGQSHIAHAVGQQAAGFRAHGPAGEQPAH